MIQKFDAVFKFNYSISSTMHMIYVSKVIFLSSTNKYNIGDKKDSSAHIKCQFIMFYVANSIQRYIQILCKNSQFILFVSI